MSFSRLYESYLSRYTAGCFIHGDVVEFTKGIEKEEAFKSLPPNLQDKLSAMSEASINGDAVICVQGVSLDPFIGDQSTPTTITLAYSLGGGRYLDPITIPGCLASHLKVIEGGSNVPKGVIKDYTVDDYYGVKEMDLNKLEKRRTKGSVESSIFNN